jgi:hypothetical protein
MNYGLRSGWGWVRFLGKAKKIIIFCKYSIRVSYTIYIYIVMWFTWQILQAMLGGFFLLFVSNQNYIIWRNFGYFNFWEGSGRNYFDHFDHFDHFGHFNFGFMYSMFQSGNFKTIFYKLLFFVFFLTLIFFLFYCRYLMPLIPRLTSWIGKFWSIQNFSIF